MGPARVTSPTLVSPALHSRGGGACAGGTVQLWAGDTSSGLFTWGGRGQQTPQAWRHGDLRSWCIGQRGDVAGKVLGGFAGGSQPLAAPPGIWVLGDPLHPPATATPRHSTDTTSEFNGGQPELQVSPHSTRHAAPSPKQHTERGWGRGNPPNPPEHTEAQQKHTARPWLRSYGGHGGGQGMAGCSRQNATGKSTHESTRRRGEPPGCGEAVGQGGRGCWGPNWGQTGAKLGALQFPCSSPQGEGAAPRCGWRHWGPLTQVAEGTVWGCDPGGLHARKGSGRTPFPSIPNNSQETAKPVGKHPSCKPGGRVHGPPSARGGAREG